MFKRYIAFLTGIVLGSILFIPPYDEAMKARYGDKASEHDGIFIPMLRGISNTFWHGVKRLLGY